MMYSYRFLLVFAAAAAMTEPAIAQDPDSELKAHQEAQAQRQRAALEKQWEGLPADEIEKRRRTVALIESSFSHIDGKKTPELVPYHIRMQHFFAAYQQGWFQRSLASELSSGDRKMLDEFSRRHDEELKKLAADYDAKWMAIGARAVSMDALQIAGAIKAATQKIQTEQSKLYRNVINGLSSDGKQRVMAFAFINVRPQVSIEDPSVVANDDPEFYKDQFLKTYDMIRKGEYPAPPASLSVDGTASTTSSGSGQLGSSPTP